MNVEEFKDFIRINPLDDDNPYNTTSSFSGRLEYSPGEPSVGTFGHKQAMDRVQYMIEIWHCQICSHPSFRNPDPEMNETRDKAANIAVGLFDLFNTLYEKELLQRSNHKVQ